jgi:hypothetical protein
MDVSGSLHSAIARAGAGAYEHRVGSGIIVEVPRVRTTTTASKKQPFRVVRTTTDDGSPAVKVSPGTINLLIPTGVREAQALSSDPQYVVIVVTTDGRQITAASIALQADLPVPPLCTIGDPPLSFKVPLAYVGTSDAPFVEQIATGNQVAQRSLCHQTEKETIPAGSSPWVNWWTWAVSDHIEPQIVEM